MSRKIDVPMGVAVICRIGGENKINPPSSESQHPQANRRVQLCSQTKKTQIQNQMAKEKQKMNQKRRGDESKEAGKKKRRGWL